MGFQAAVPYPSQPQRGPCSWGVRTHGAWGVGVAWRKNVHQVVGGLPVINVISIGWGYPQPTPRRSMYGIFTYIWLIFMINVGEYTIHGSYGTNREIIICSFLGRAPYKPSFSTVSRPGIPPKYRFVTPCLSMFHDSPQMGRASAGALKPWKVIRADLRFLWPTKNHLYRPGLYSIISIQARNTFIWYNDTLQLEDYFCVWSLAVCILVGWAVSICKAANQLIWKAASRSQDEGVVACFIILASQDRWRLNILGILGGGFKDVFHVHPQKLGKWSNLTCIFFKWVGSTTNQYLIDLYA